MIDQEMERRIEELERLMDNGELGFPMLVICQCCNEFDGHKQTKEGNQANRLLPKASNMNKPRGRTSKQSTNHTKDRNNTLLDVSAGMTRVRRYLQHTATRDCVFCVMVIMHPLQLTLG
jgi:hypothetical protein